MPREKIHDDLTQGPFRLDIGWGSLDTSGHVHVEVVQDQGISLLWQLYGRQEDLDSLGEQLGERSHELFNMDNEERARAVLNMIERNMTHYSICTYLDRAGCNTAIKTLRRARDSAYGKDE